MNIIRSLFENRINSLSIILDRSNQTFYPGEIITGRLVFTLSESINQDGLQLSFIGRVNTLIQVSHPKTHHHGQTITRSGNNTTIITTGNVNNHHSVHENYELFRHVFQFAPNGISSKLGPGNHELPFQFIIPINVPSTFQYKRWAYVEYRIKANVGGKSKELDIQLMGFPSVAPNELYAPIQDEQSKTVGLFNGKKLTMRCHIPQAGWKIGSTIPITVNIDNYSDKMMTLSASIKQDIQILAHNHRETFREKILTTFGQQVSANFIGGQYQIQIVLPKEGLPIIHNNCRTIQINYSIEIKLDIPLAINLYCKLPIILTNQQLDPQQQQQPLPNYYPQSGQMPQPFGQPPAANPNFVYPSLDPNNSGAPSAPPIGFAEAPPPYSEEFGNNSQTPIAPYPTIHKHQ